MNIAEKKIPTAAISIVTWNSANEIRICLKNLADLKQNWQVWVADNASKDDTVSIIKNEFPFVNLIANIDNKGFAEANNQIINQTNTDFILLLNPDTEVEVSELEKALKKIEENSDIGILGVKLLNDDGSLQVSCYSFPTLWKNFVMELDLYNLYSGEKQTELFIGDFFAHNQEREVDWIMGAFMLVRRDAIKKAGAIPEDYFMFAEDLDWCWQIHKSGYKILFSPEIAVKHKSNQSAGQLPSNWRVERTVFSKHLFGLKNFGAIVGRLIQLTDYLGVNYKILRLSRKKNQQDKINELKMYRTQYLKALFSTRRKIKQTLMSR